MEIRKDDMAVLEAVAKEGRHSALNNVYVQPGRLVACDGRLLAIREVPLEEEEAPFEAYLLEAKSLKSAANGGGPASFGFSGVGASAFGFAQSGRSTFAPSALARATISAARAAFLSGDSLADSSSPSRSFAMRVVASGLGAPRASPPAASATAVPVS